MAQLMLDAKVADIASATSGDNTVIAAVSGSPIYIYQLWVEANAAVNLKFGHGATPTYFNSVALPLTAQGSAITFQYTGLPWFRCLPGEAFILNLSGNVQMIGQVYYKLG